MASVAITKPLGGMRKALSTETILTWAILLPIAIVAMAPLAHVAAMAFSPESDQYNYPIRFFPDHPTLDNYTHIFADATLPVVRWFTNSVIVSTSTTALVLLLSSLSAYAFGRLQFPGRDQIFFVLLISLMVPIAATIIPSFLLLRDLKLLDTYHAIIWPGAASVGGIFLLRQHFFAIPRDLEEAAIVDGAGRFRVYWQVCLPLVRSAMVALGIFTFLGSWNDLFWPFVVLSERTGLTLPVGLLILGQGSYIQRGLAFAGAFISSMPPLILYSIFQRQIIQGITTAGLGGR